MTVDAPSPPVAENDLLAALTDRDRERLAPHLERIEVAPGAALLHRGDRVRHAYFPCGQAVAGYRPQVAEGSTVLATLVGREGAIGTMATAGPMPAYADVEVHLGGEMLRIEVDLLEDAKHASLAIRRLFDRYAHCALSQAIQLVACNASHSTEQRTAKWLTTLGGGGGQPDLRLNQTQLAAMLGVGRSYVSRVMQSFIQRGAVANRRGSIVLLDVDALRAISCRCDEIVRAYFHRTLADAAATAASDLPN